MTDMSVNFCGIQFKNPIITASGTFGYGQEYSEYYDLKKLGGITLKTVTPDPREGNPPHRIAEVTAGILNSVGLQNPGAEQFFHAIWPKVSCLHDRIILNIAGNTMEEYAKMAEYASQTDAALVEVNVSCPNVSHGGLAFGADPKVLENVTKVVRAHCKKPMVIKLTPNVTDIAEMARAAESGGADGVSLINTLLGMKIDLKTRQPILHRNVGGFSGPAVKPIAVRMIWQVKNAVSIPIIGMGGVMCGEDAAELMLAGATLVAVGTANLITPTAAIDVLNGLCTYAKDCKSVQELIGGVRPY